MSYSANLINYNKYSYIGATINVYYWQNWLGHRRYQAQYRKPDSKMSLFANKCPR